jgi:hypothetical protein
MVLRESCYWGKKIPKCRISKPDIIFHQEPLYSQGISSSALSLSNLLLLPLITPLFFKCYLVPFHLLAILSPDLYIITSLIFLKLSLFLLSSLVIDVLCNAWVAYNTPKGGTTVCRWER